MHQFFCCPCVKRSTYLVSWQFVNLEHGVGYDLRGIWWMKVSLSCHFSRNVVCVFWQRPLFSLSDLLGNSLTYVNFFLMRWENFFPHIFFLSISLCYIRSLERTSRSCLVHDSISVTHAARYLSSAFTSRGSKHTTAWLYCKKKQRFERHEQFTPPPQYIPILLEENNTQDLNVPLP